MLKLIIALSTLALAQAGLPGPSPDMSSFHTGIQGDLKAIHDMGPLCHGGGRKWAKIHILRLRISESPAVRRMDSRLETLPESCRKVAYAGGHFDFAGTETVIPQRVARSREMNSTAKAECLQYWGDWKVIEQVYEKVGPVLSRWQEECVGPEVAPAPTQQTGGGVR